MSNLIKTIEVALGKALEEVVDFTTFTFKCKPCAKKLKFISEETIIESAKEKAKKRK
jgi:hypothetical protein